MPSIIAVVVFHFINAPVLRMVSGTDPLAPDLVAARRAAVLDFISAALFLRAEFRRRAKLNARNKFLIILGVILAASTAYYFVSTPRSSDLVLIGTVDSNQIIVSPQIPGRIAKLLVDEGTQVKQGDLIAILDPSELEAEARAAAAMIDSLRSQVSASQATSAATHGSTSSNVVNAQARCRRPAPSCCRQRPRCSAPKATAAA